MTTLEERLFQHVKEFIKVHEITCREDTCQSDEVLENASDFIEGCCDIVGYEKGEE